MIKDCNKRIAKMENFQWTDRKREVKIFLDNSIMQNITDIRKINEEIYIK